MIGYISKNKADWLFQEVFCDEEYCGGSCYKCGKEAQYRNKLLQEPDADVQLVVHAYWIELPKALNPNENPCECSNCGHVLSFMNGYPKSKYCDDCGAKMDGDTNG